MAATKQRFCIKHGVLYDRVGSSKFFACRQCNVQAVNRRRMLVKRKAIEYKGNKCQVCGYDKCIGALEFHHLDPKLKEFSIGDGDTRKWELVVQELDKCILVCANCHREIEYCS